MTQRPPSTSIHFHPLPSTSIHHHPHAPRLSVFSPFIRPVSQEMNNPPMLEMQDDPVQGQTTGTLMNIPMNTMIDLWFQPSQIPLPVGSKRCVGCLSSVLAFQSQIQCCVRECCCFWLGSLACASQLVCGLFYIYIYIQMYTYM